MVDKNPQFYAWCPVLNCEEGFIEISGGGKVKCNKCSTEICTKCK